METYLNKDGINPEEISSQQPANALPRYEHDVHQVAELFAQSGFQIAERTITSYCRANLLDCEKFVNGNVTKWKITQDSIDRRIETLKREGGISAGSSQQEPASTSASSSPQQPAHDALGKNELVEILKGELKEKNDQIREYQSIIHSHNALFDNLNKTIQLSNQSLQQLNGIIALPQVNEIVQKQTSSAMRDYTYEVPIRKIDMDQPDDVSNDGTQNNTSLDSE